MYSGPGPGPMLAAASAWDSVAAELGTAAATYDSVIRGLTSEEWLGPASESAAAAAAPYVAWMADTATQAEHTATSVRAAVGAYETAFSATVAPPLIAANRLQLTQLTATNFFGQNSPAIAATEAQYSEMWAQDAGAMYGYAGASANASAVTPFANPPQTTNSSGQPGQDASSAASKVASAIPQALQHLSSATASSTLTSAATTTTTTTTTPTDPLTWLYNQLLGLTGANRTIVGQRTVGDLGYFPLGMAQFNASIGQQLIPGTPGGAGAGGSSPLAPGGWGPGPWGAAPGVSGGVGQAGTVGRLSVPSSWAAAAPPAGPATGPAPVTTISASSHGGPNGLLRGVPMSTAGAGRRATGTFVHKYGFRHTVMPRSPLTG